jgi:hypothetical protein
MITRRATRRHFVFKPDAMMTQIFLYCLGLAAGAFEIRVHAFVLLSDHYHLCVSDPTGRVSAFLHKLDFYLAEFTKCYRGWPGEVFDKQQANIVEILNPRALIVQLAYIITNPVKAFCVSRAGLWPGAITVIADLGARVFVAKRPPFWADANKKDKWPDEVELGLVIPKELGDYEGGEARALEVLEKLVRFRERRAADDARARGKQFQGARRCTRAKHTARASSYEKFGARVPRFAAGGDREALREAHRRYRLFVAEYRDCLARWRERERDVIWPYGTWEMRVLHNVPCHPPPPS